MSLKKLKSPLTIKKMQNVERAIWLGCIVFMIATLSLTNLQNDSPENKIPKITPVAETPVPPRMLVNIKGMNGYSAQTDLQKGSITLVKNDSNLSLEIELSSSPKSIAETVARKAFKGPNAWQYYIDENWDSTHDTKAYDNIHRVFFTQENGMTIKAYEYDYAAGKYDKEIDNILDGVTFL